MLFLLLLLAAGWPSFRGPNGSGVSDAREVPVEFGPATNVAWKTAVPAGTSSPVLLGDLVVLTGAADGRLLTLAYDRRTGRPLWRSELQPQRNEARHKLNSAASATPATDGESLFVFFPDYGLVSYDLRGNQRWQIPLGPFTNLHGMAASPLAHGPAVYLVCDQDTGSFVLAVDKNTGRTLWKAGRPDVVHGFATPNIFHPRKGSPQLIVPGSYQITSYDAATGKRLWWAHGLTWQVKTSAVTDGEIIYATGWAPGADEGQRSELPPFESALARADADGDKKLANEELPPEWKHGGSWNFIDLDRDGKLDERDWAFYRGRRAAHNVTLAIRPGDARGDLTDSHVVWKYDRSVPQVSSPLLYDHLLYTVKDGGIVTALDAASGAVRKQARLPGAIGSYYSSPIAAGGRLYIANEGGKITVLKPGPAWEVLAVNDLQEPCYATPAPAEGELFVRTAATLYCFRTTP